MTNEQIISALTGLSAKKSKELVDYVDEENKIRNEEFADRFAKALAAGINASCRGKIWEQDVKNAKKAGLSLNEFLFVQAFNREFNTEDIL